MNYIAKIHKSDTFVYFICVLFTIAGILVSLNRFWQYDVYYYDFGIFDQAIWSVSRFQPPIIEHLVVGGKWIFADHFNPSIFLLTPAYWITDRSEVILIAQSILVGLSGFFIYQIGLLLLKNRLLSFSILVSYFLFLGLQNAVITEFHEVTISVLPLSIALWALFKQKFNLYLLMLVLTLGFKESNFLLGIALSIFIVILGKRFFKIGIVTFLISCIWGFVSIKFIIPYFSGGLYQYGNDISRDLMQILQSFVNHPDKRNTLLYSFWSFGFLPLLSFETWPLILQDFAQRFIPNWPTRWTLGLHYNAQLAVILSISSIYSLKRLQKLVFLRRVLPFIAILLILNAIYLYRFVLHGPFGLVYNSSFYAHTKDFNFLNVMIKKIPKDATVMTHNNLAARFTHQKLYLLKHNYHIYNPDYILIDNRIGQSPNNFFSFLVHKGDIFDEINRYVIKLRSDSNYELIYNTNEQFIFKRVNK